MKRIIFALASLVPFFVFASPAFAVTAPSEITSYTNSTLQLIIAIASVSALFFLVRGGYLYMTSAGSPDTLEAAKKTIKNALIGLVMVLASGLLVSIFTNSFGAVSTGGSSTTVNIPAIETVDPPDGLTVVLTDAISGLFNMIIRSAATPIMNGVISYLTTTPTLLDNSIIRNYWLIILGITDSLFVLVVALLGLRFMSAEAFGFEEMELRHLLPRIGLAFLGANVSLFLANYAIITCNALVSAVLNSTGGLSQALLIDAITPTGDATVATPFVILVFLLIFLIVSIVLLLMYVSRLIFISLGAVLSPLIFLMWSMPKFSDFAEIAVKAYLVSVFTVFVHIVVIQLASAFISLPAHSENNIVSIVVGIGLFFTLLKIPGMLMQMAFYSTGAAAIYKIGKEIVNVISTSKSEKSNQDDSGSGRSIKKSRANLGV